MTPLARVAWGYLIVVIDIRIDGFDLVADLLGWMLVLSGLFSLVQRTGWFQAAAIAAGVGALLAVPQLVAEPVGLLTVAQGIVETGLVFGTCTGIMRQPVEERQRTTANRIRWVHLGLAAVATVAGLAAGEPREVSGGAAGLVLLLVLAALAVVAWFTIFLLGVQRHPDLGPRPRVPA